MKGFLSDNSSSVDPVILESFSLANDGHVYPYGDDPYTQQLEKMFNDLFEVKSFMTLVMNGTGANVNGLASVLRSYESVLSVDSAHINVDECGAFESYTNAKIVTVPHVNGKIDVTKLDEHLEVKGNFHHNQPKVISISQVTEFGSVYTIDELKVIVDYAHTNDLYVHMDGARISNALVALDCTLNEMIVETGIDLVSFGGTKNGMMYGEAIICFEESIYDRLLYIRKQSMQLASKMRYISCQFIKFLENDRYLHNARIANEMCARLYEGLKGIKGISFEADVDANIIFAKIPIKWMTRLLESEHFYPIDEKLGIIRLVASFDTTKKDVDDFIKKVKQISIEQ